LEARRPDRRRDAGAHPRSPRSRRHPGAPQGAGRVGSTGLAHAGMAALPVGDHRDGDGDRRSVAAGRLARLAALGTSAGAGECRHHCDAGARPRRVPLVRHHGGTQARDGGAMTEAWGAALYGQPCRECGFDWSLSADDALHVVGEIADAFEVRLSEATGTERHPDLSWTPTAYVCHVTDNLRIWAER